MAQTQQIISHIRRLEARLLDPTVRASASDLDDLLADNFREFGASGQIYDKVTTVKQLTLAPTFDGPRTIIDFHAEELAANVVLITYEIAETRTLRSSIWQEITGQWRIVFHQGTRLKE